MLTNSRDVLHCSSGNPFAEASAEVGSRRALAILVHSLEEKQRTGMWWRRELLGLYAPVLQLDSDGKPNVISGPRLYRRMDRIGILSNHRVSMTDKKKAAPRRKWSAKVKTESTYPPEGLFNKSAAVIARTLASPEVSPKGPGSGMRMLSF